MGPERGFGPTSRLRPSYGVPWKTALLNGFSGANSAELDKNQKKVPEQGSTLEESLLLTHISSPF